MRNVREQLKNKLIEIKKQKEIVYRWETFYEFILLSFQVELVERYSVSDLFFELKKIGVDEAAEMIKIYAHGLYLLAKANNIEIYGDFNV